MDEEKVHKEIETLYEKTSELDKKMAVIETNQQHYTDALEKVAESNTKLVDTLQNMQITFIKMDGKIDKVSKDIVDTKNQVNGIDTRMKKIESDNSFEIAAYLKKYFPLVIVGLGVVALWFGNFIKI